MEIRLRDHVERLQLPPGIEVEDFAEYQIEYGQVASYLTQPAIEKGSGTLLYEAIKDKEIFAQRAAELLTGLDQELDNWYRNGPYTYQWFSDITRAIEAAEASDFSLLNSYGFEMDATWLNDMVRSMLKRQPVEIQIATTNTLAMTYSLRTPELQYTPDYQGILTGQTGGMYFASMLKQLPCMEYVRPVVIMDDALYPTERFAGITHAHRDAVVCEAARQLEFRYGIISPEDQPGSDFIMMRYSDLAITAVDELIEELRQCEEGLVVPYRDGSLWYRPFPWIAERVERKSLDTRQKLVQPGILLKEPGGRPTKVAYHAASFLDPVNKAFTHISLVDQASGAPSEQEINAVLSSLNLITRDHSHSISYDSDRVSENVTLYVLTRLLRHAVCAVAESFTAYDTTAAMKPEVYLQHNYGNPEGVWEEDVQGINALATLLPRFLSPGSVSSAAIIGYGPFSWPALAIAPYLAPTATLDISDILPKNIALVEQWRNGQASPEHAAVYETFGDLFRYFRPDFYHDCETRLQQQSSTRVAALEQLESNSVQVLMESFVTCRTI